MFCSPPGGTVHTSRALPDRPHRAAKEQAEPDPAVAIATRARPGLAAVRWLIGSERSFPIGIGGWSSRPGPCAISISTWYSSWWSRAARHVSSATYAPLGVLDRSPRGLERFVTAGVDEVTRRRIDAVPRGRGVLAELLADPVPLRAAILRAHCGSRGFPGEHPPNDDLFGRPGDDRRGANRGLGADREGWGGGAQRAWRGGRSARSAFPGVAIDHVRPDTGLMSGHSDSRRAMGAGDAMMRLARAVDGEHDWTGRSR